MSSQNLNAFLSDEAIAQYFYELDQSKGTEESVHHLGCVRNSNAGGLAHALAGSPARIRAETC
jgi:hypothetical protein